MTAKKKSIQVKLELKDELKELIEAESEREFRSCTQQVYYILNKYYKEGFGVKKEQNNNEKELIYNNKELLGTNSEQLCKNENFNNQNEFIQHNNNTNNNFDDQESLDIEPIEDSFISSDILDF
jgi:hypothetical protein